MVEVEEERFSINMVGFGKKPNKSDIKLPIAHTCEKQWNSGM